MSSEQTSIGRPRSEAARTAVLHAVDDLLVEQGYAAMTLKGIAARAGVSRQTIYRWWSTKAEILFEASWTDAAHELATEPADNPRDEIVRYLRSLVRFLTQSPAGAAYRALLGEAQHDSAVAQLLTTRDILGESAARVLQRIVDPARLSLPVDDATALLVGPTFYAILAGRGADSLDVESTATRYLEALSLPPSQSQDGSTTDQI